ncbi:MAG: CPBP family intramembrane metalloprotease [Clostridia bacterium]|nr:CPBP family intramembrane metalloprotease [Clostridia bacterium]
MNNFKVKEMVKFSFYKSIQNKWFVIFNAITLISIVLILNWGSIGNLFKIGEEESIRIAILDEENIVFEKLVSKLAKNFEVEKIVANDYTAENIPDDLIILEINPNEEKTFSTAIISKEGIVGEYYYKIEDALHYCRNVLFADQYDISIENLDKFQSELEIERIMLSVDATDSDTKEIIKLFSTAATYMIAILLFSKIANEISQEKQSKSSEYILTTVSEKEYLFAKIFSNIAILIFQGLLMIVYYYIAAIISRIPVMNDAQMGGILEIMTTPGNIETLLYVTSLIIYNILNLILLCIIQAALSAKTSSTSEAGNTVSLLSFIMMASYIIALEFITPYTKVNIILGIVSCLPILSAYFIPALMVVGQISLWQIILSLTLILISIPVSFNISSKIFKNGILDYTKIKKTKKKKEEKDTFFIKRKMKNLGFVIGMAIIIYFGIQTIFSVIGTFVLPTVFKNILLSEDMAMILQIILQITSLGLASIFVLSYCNKKDIRIEKEQINNKQKIKIIFISIFVIFVIQALFTTLIYPAIGLDYNITDTFTTDESSSLISKIILVLAIAATPAVFEEIFFRKAMIDYMSQYGTKTAWILSSLFFGMIHMNLSQALFAFIAGLIFGGIYLYTKDIKLTMLIHFINNGFGALGMILPELGLILATGILIVFFIIGLVLFIIELTKKEIRTKIKEVLTFKISREELINYKYIFTDFTFDVSMILVFLMSVLTENMLR